MFSYFGIFSKPTHTPDNPHHDSRIGSNGDDQRRDEDERDSDLPPIFPALDSIQRSAGSTSTPQINHPTLKIDSIDDDENQHEEDDYSQAVDDLDLENLSLPPSTLQKPKKPRKKVKLMPGFSQLDWAKLKASGANLRGEHVTGLRRITRSELAEHRTKEDAWSGFHGKVYNITPYLNYHPGGVRELMRVAGKDGTELFMKTHAWISIDAMLDTCLLGFLVHD